MADPVFEKFYPGGMRSGDYLSVEAEPYFCPAVDSGVCTFPGVSNQSNGISPRRSDTLLGYDGWSEGGILDQWHFHSHVMGARYRELFLRVSEHANGSNGGSGL